MDIGLWHLFALFWGVGFGIALWAEINFAREKVREWPFWRRALLYSVYFLKNLLFWIGTLLVIRSEKKKAREGARRNRHRT